MAGDLNVTWIHGSPDCATNADPPLQVHRYDRDTFILRQSKCSDPGTPADPWPSFEAPFFYLLFGEKRALLLDTGASHSGACPVAPTVRGVIDRWLAERGRASIPLVVTHSHNHHDHTAGDSQFAGMPGVTVVPAALPGMTSFFGLDRWPDQIHTFDLGGRALEIIPTPGHEEAHIALYDPAAGLLLTGDTLYPGLLVVYDWGPYSASIARLKAFADGRTVRHILGAHVEMTDRPRRWFGLGALFQPGEHVLQLEPRHLAELNTAVQAMVGQPRTERHDDFIIYPASDPLPPP